MDYINASEMRVIDINSAYHGVSSQELMENAGRAVFEELVKLGIEGRRIAVLCGAGNNGGDGMVAARLLGEKGYRVDVYLVGGRGAVKTREAGRALRELEKKGLGIKEVSSAEEVELEADIAVDALLGTGIEGEPREPYKGLIELLNRSPCRKVSVDVPSGLGSETCVQPDLVVALHAAKEGLQEFANVIVKDIGVPEKAWTHTGPGCLIVNLRRRAGSHKGDNGRVLVIGGSSEFHGAPLLCSLGALYSGCDLVTLYAPEPVAEVARSFSPDLVVRAYAGEHLNQDAVGKAVELLQKQDVVVLGPGMGVAEETGMSVNTLLASTPIPAVIDADALKVVDKEVIRGLRRAVLTPHAHELELLTGEQLPSNLEERREAVLTWAGRLGSVILLKAGTDIIAGGDGKWRLNETGNAGMTVGGTGDVLAGMVASFMAQGMEGFEAACCAAFVNGAAGDRLHSFKGFGFTASELAKELPYTIKSLIDEYG